MEETTDWGRPPRPIELDRLHFLLGDWESEDTHYPMPWAPQPANGNSRHSFKLALDGYCLLSDYSGQLPFGDLKGHGMWFFDSSKHHYRIVWYDSYANFLEGEGLFEADDRFVFHYQYRMAGQDVRERHTIFLLSPQHFEHRIETLLEGSYQLTSELSYRRLLSGELP